MTAIENLKCHGCGGKGHFERDCQNREIDGASRRPPWCGICDPQTRLVGLGPDGPMARCSDCHPLRGQLLVQHKRCTGCRILIYSWDNNPCGKHSSPAVATNRGMSRDEIDAIVAKEGVRK